MEKSWEISGVIGTWKMTVAVLDPDGAVPDLLPDEPVPLSDFEGLGEHFRTLVDLTEAHWRLDQRR